MRPQLAENRSTNSSRTTSGRQATARLLASTGCDINKVMASGRLPAPAKLWNASAPFIAMNTEIGLRLQRRREGGAWPTAGSGGFNHTVKRDREALDNFRFDIAAGILYEFTPNQFCDWHRN